MRLGTNCYWVRHVICMLPCMRVMFLRNLCMLCMLTCRPDRCCRPCTKWRGRGGAWRTAPSCCTAGPPACPPAPRTRSTVRPNYLKNRKMVSLTIQPEMKLTNRVSESIKPTTRNDYSRNLARLSTFRFLAGNGKIPDALCLDPRAPTLAEILCHSHAVDGRLTHAVLTPLKATFEVF